MAHLCGADGTMQSLTLRMPSFPGPGDSSCQATDQCARWYWHRNSWVKVESSSQQTSASKQSKVEDTEDHQQ